MFGELHTFQQLVYCTYQNYVSYFVYFLEYLNYLASWIPCVFFRDITLLHKKKKNLKVQGKMNLGRIDKAFAYDNRIQVVPKTNRDFLLSVAQTLFLSEVTSK